MKKLTISLSAFALAFLLALPAQAQVKLGVNGQYGIDYEQFQLGAEAHVPLVGGLSLVPNAEFYMQDGVDQYTLNGDIHYAIGEAYTRVFTPYAGLGVGVTRNRQFNDTEVGLNVIGGANFRAGRAAPFVQLEWRTGDYGDLSVGGGVRFLLW